MLLIASFRVLTASLNPVHLCAGSIKLPLQVLHVLPELLLLISHGIYLRIALLL